MIVREQPECTKQPLEDTELPEGRRPERWIESRLIVFASQNSSLFHDDTRGLILTILCIVTLSFCLSYSFLQECSSSDHSSKFLMQATI